MSLSIKYRPKVLDEVIGNSGTIEKLKSQVNKPTPHQSYLFYGPSGCGKTTLARILAKEFGCSDINTHEFNTSNTRGIDTIRWISEASQFVPIVGGNKLFLMDECHKLTNDAQNAFLKLLEEPPGHVYFVLSTTEPDKLIPTILKGRVMKFEVSPLTDKEMIYLLTKVSKEEGFSYFPPSVMKKISEMARGVPREALTLLDSILTIAPVDESGALSILDESDFSEAQVNKICQQILKYNWKEVSRMSDTLKGDPEQVRWAMLGYFRSVLHRNGNDAIAKIMMYFKEPYTFTGKAGLSWSCYMASRSGG